MYGASVWYSILLRLKASDNAVLSMSVGCWNVNMGQELPGEICCEQHQNGRPHVLGAGLLVCHDSWCRMYRGGRGWDGWCTRADWWSVGKQKIIALIDTILLMSWSKCAFLILLLQGNKSRRQMYRTETKKNDAYAMKYLCSLSYNRAIWTNPWFQCQYIISNLTLYIDQSIHAYMFSYVYSLSELFCTSSMDCIISNLYTHVLPYEFKHKLGQIWCTTL
jgi:hypothetical protein